MKKIIFIILAALMFVSCYKDNSSLVYPSQNPRFDSIKVESPLAVMSVDLGDEFSFTPTVTQNIEGRPLSYKWHLNTLDEFGKLGEQIKIGEEQTLNYTFEEEGSYRLTLEVINTDFTQFETWTINVRTYDEGFLLIGNYGDGSADLTFGRALSDSDILAGKERITFNTNLFKSINPNVDVRDIVHIAKSSSSSGYYLFVFTRTKIYLANPTTFAIVADYDFSGNINGEEIVSVLMNDHSSPNSTHLFTNKGNVYQYDRNEKIITLTQFTQMPYAMDDCNYVRVMSGQYFVEGYLAIDRKNSLLWTSIYYMTDVNGKSINYPVNNTYGPDPDNANRATENFYENSYEGYDILEVIRMTGDYRNSKNKDLFTVCTKKGSPNEVRIVQFTYSIQRGYIKDVVAPYDYTATNFTFDGTITPVSNGRYEAIYYTKDNKVYEWRPLASPPGNQLPTEPVIDLSGSGKEITCLTLSWDTKQLYVGYYDNSSSEELKGGFTIYDCDNLKSEPIESYENISPCKPIEIKYKGKNKDFFIL